MEKSKDRAAAFLNSLPRHVKSAPIIEAIVGANGTDLLEAIFDVDVDPEQLEPLFGSDDFFERAQILTQHSEQGRSRTASVAGTKDTTAPPTSPKPQVDTINLPSSNSLQTRAALPRNGPSTTGETEPNKLRKRSQTPARPVSTGGHLMALEEEPANFQSPLARLFSSAQRKPPRPIDYAPSNIAFEEALIGIKRLEGAVERIEAEQGEKGYVQKLRADVKELQVRSLRCSNGRSAYKMYIGATSKD